MAKFWFAIIVSYVTLGELHYICIFIDRLFSFYLPPSFLIEPKLDPKNQMCPQL